MSTPVKAQKEPEPEHKTPKRGLLGRIQRKKHMKYKILNGHCVPVSTPDNYFEQSAKDWLRNHRKLVEAGKNIMRANLERELARMEYEEER